MTKKSKTKASNKPAKKVKLSLATELCQLAKQQTEAAENEAVSLIENALRTGQVHSLHEALNNSDPEAWEWLVGLIYDCASNPLVGVSATGATMQAWLFAIPIIFAGDIPASRALSGTPAFDTMTKALRKSGLVSEGPSVILSSYLYSTKELLNTDFNDIYQFPSRIIRELDGKFVQPEKLLRTSPIKLSNSPGEPTLSVRFMVGIVIEDIEDDCFLSPYTESPENEGESFKRHNEIMATALGDVFDKDNLVSPGYAPMPFYPAIGCGLADMYITGMLANFALELGRHGLTEKAVKAVVSHHFDDEDGTSVQVGFSSKLNGTLIYGHTIETQNIVNLLGPEWCANLITEALAATNVELIAIEGEHPVRHCNDCGERTYFSTDGHAGLHPNAEATTSHDAPRRLH